MKYALLSLLAAGLAGSATAADPTAMTLRSTTNRTTLVELYTSEGCSSCPPAESWLSQLKQSPGLWRDFVPVAFHVDYWDYLGWRDPWGAKDFSNRQRAYATAWNSRSVYTPGFVRNGGEWSGWSGASVSPVKESTGILQATTTDAQHWQIEFKPTKAVGKYDVYAAQLGSALRSDVRAGENGGRRLDHDFVALSLVKASLMIENGALRGELTLPMPAGKNAGRAGIAIWVTAAGQLEPLQAVGGWTTSPATK